MKRFCEANVIVLDTSGSMDLKDTSNNLSRLENAKRAISSFVRLRRELPSVHDSYFKVVPFDTSAKLDMFSVIRGDMPCGVNQLKADNSTAIYRSLAQALDQIPSWFSHLSPTNINLVLLTDGDDNSSSDDLKSRFSALERTLKSSNLGRLQCVCYVISQQPNKTFLNQLSSAVPGGSKVVHVDNAAALEKNLRTFAEEVVNRETTTFEGNLDLLINNLQQIRLMKASQVRDVTKQAVGEELQMLLDWKDLTN